MLKKVENGRTMVEMLGTLAIMGVLSVTGVAGYTWAIERSRVNNLMHEITMRTASVSTAMLAEKTPSLAEFDENSQYIDGVTFSLGSPLSFSSSPNATDQQFAIVVKGVPKKICKKIFGMVGSGGGKTPLRELKHRERNVMTSVDDCRNSTDLAFVYNRDLSEGPVFSKAKTPEECEKAQGYWCNDIGGGGSACLANSSTCCDDVSCDDGQTCRSGKCVACEMTTLEDGTSYCKAEGDTDACTEYHYNATYCISCSAAQGQAHCPYEGYKYYGNQCTCGDNAGCGYYRCTKCEDGQKIDCPEWGDCHCMYDDEKKTCDYQWGCDENGKNCEEEYGCVVCGPGETAISDECYGEGKCVPEGQKGACGECSGCIVCPPGQEATCGAYDSSCICHDPDEQVFCPPYSSCVKCAPGEKMVCNGNGGYGQRCTCQKEGENAGCSNIYDDCGCGGQSCISCPAGQKPLCIEKSTYMCCDDVNLCKCVDENANTMCPDNFDYDYNVDKCAVCDAGISPICEGTDCSCLPEGYTFKCNGGECITCSPDEGVATCPIAGVCFCLAEDETYKCSSTKCIECTADQGEATCPYSGECVCAPAGSETLCNKSRCISCTSEQGTPACSDSGECICVPDGVKYECSASECIMCTGADETPVCAEMGSCICLPEGSTYDCGESGCITCTPEEGTAKCPASGADCVCVPAGSSYDCSTTGCKTCTPEEGEAQCSKYGECICVPEGSNYQCSIWECVSCTEAEGQPNCERNCTCTKEEVCQMGGENINGVCCKSGKEWNGTAYVEQTANCGCSAPSECQKCELVNGTAQLSFLPQGTKCIQSEVEGTCSAYGQCKPSGGTSCSSETGCGSGYFCNYGGTFGNYSQGYTPNICQKVNPKTYTYQGVTYYYNTATDLKSWCRGADGGTNCIWGYLAYNGAKSWCASLGKRLLTAAEYAEVASVIAPLLPTVATKPTYWLSDGSIGNWDKDYTHINHGIGRTDGYANCCGVLCR